ncbi:hypothetical protein BT96DRAFT_998946 [Gymnopus androsaceus JB14]|uniref:Ribonuclease H1 N-terminal domain-containing protein n=1 Tax=Gymnopus androsaceus JB14 TaxID=1447944 RepID=A0A6A4H8B4_9AGAR|nr:hypothetical protein BT96DRAFT_998946 [Gymnopus androsaceus JB14]
MQQTSLPPAFYEAMSSLVQALNSMALSSGTSITAPGPHKIPTAITGAGSGAHLAGHNENPAAITGTGSGARLAALTGLTSTANIAGSAIPFADTNDLAAGGPTMTATVAGASQVPVESPCGCSCHSAASLTSTVWYAITKGRRVSVYSSWALVQDAVLGCCAAYRKFGSREEAEAYFNDALANQLVAVL